MTRYDEARAHLVGFALALQDAIVHGTVTLSGVSGECYRTMLDRTVAEYNRAVTPAQKG